VSFEEWLIVGIAKGWCSDLYCCSHDMAPMTEEEIDAFEEGDDPCVPALRLWGSQLRDTAASN